MANSGSQRQIVVEMSYLMDSAVAKERKKNQKLQQKLAKVTKKLENKQASQNEDESNETQEDPSDPNSWWLKPGEIVIILDNMKSNLHFLAGNGKSAQYKKTREMAWKKLIDEINEWNESEGTGKVRQYAKIKKKINNMKKNGLFLNKSLFYKYIAVLLILKCGSKTQTKVK